MTIPENAMRFRPMLIGDVADVAGEPRETIRTREKKGIYPFEERFGIPRAKGWKRYTDFETIFIAIHAHLKRAIHDDEMAEAGALIVGGALMEEWIEDEKGVPYFLMDSFRRHRTMFFWRDENGAWVVDIANSPEESEVTHNRLIDESFKETPVFTVVNLGRIMTKVFCRILEVQIRNEEAKNGGAS